MASHGVLRPATKEQRSVEAREKELNDITRYRALVDFVNQKVAEQEFSPDLLEKTAALLQKNPEYYTIWNIRRRIYDHEFEAISQSVVRNEITHKDGQSQILDILNLDLQLVFTLMLKFPKCYWIWNHRIWLLEQSSLRLTVDDARRIWENELSLVSKMLTRDSRNFMGWGYRRFIIRNLEGTALNGRSMAKDEYDYTTKMIGTNLSNFSAWHNRTKLIVQMLNEQEATPDERQSMLDKELELIHNALFDPEDQSLWFYHQVLMSAFDPDHCQASMAPGLTDVQRLSYIAKEETFLQELLLDADECKWVYQALIECAVMRGKLDGATSQDTKDNIREWLQSLKTLDPLRLGRWKEVEARLSV